MIANASETDDWLAKRRFYRRLLFGVLLAGIVGMFVATRFDFPLLGVGLYWAGFLAFLAVYATAPVRLFDERDNELERRASHYTLLVSGAILIVAAPGLTLLEEADIYDTPTFVEGAIWGYVALYALFGVVYLVTRSRR